MISLLITLVVIGAILYVVEKVIPMDPGIKTIIRVIVLIAVLLWLAEAFGLWHGSFPLR